MKKEFQIKEPCYAARENMQEIPGGSFCGHCAKKVYDLSDKTDDEIKLLLQSNSSVCGRIQAQRLYIPEENQKLQTTFFNFHLEK